MAQRHAFERVGLSFVGADLKRKRQFVLSQGTLGESCQSASSAPGAWRPFRTEGARVVDGGVINNVGASVAWKPGVDFVLASNIVPRDTEGKDKPIGERRWMRWVPLAWRFDDTARSLDGVGNHMGRDRAGLAAYLFDSGLEGDGIGDFGAGDRIYRAGKRLVRDVIDGIRAAYEHNNPGRF